MDGEVEEVPDYGRRGERKFRPSIDLMLESRARPA